LGWELRIDSRVGKKAVQRRKGKNITDAKNAATCGKKIRPEESGQGNLQGSEKETD